MILFNFTDLPKTRAEDLIQTYLVNLNLKENSIYLDNRKYDLLHINTNTYQIKENYERSNQP